LNYKKSTVIFAGNTAAALVGVDGNTLCGIFVPIKDVGGGDVSATVSAGINVVLQPAQLAGVRFVKIKSCTKEAVERELKLAVLSV
jgi:hypothetical protein